MTTRRPTALRFPPCALLLAAACALPARADRAQLPGDGDRNDHYPMSLTNPGQWKASAGALRETPGASRGIFTTPAMALPPGTVVEAEFPVPPLPPHACNWPDRFGVVALDLLGKEGDGAAACTVEVLDAAGTVLGQAQVSSSRPHLGGAGWSCDNQDGSEPLAAALDGKPDSLWHTDWHHPSPLPHHLQWDAGAPAEIGGFTYAPRKDWRTGMVKKWELRAQGDDGAWSTVASGSFDYPNRDLSPKTVVLPKPAGGRAFRFVALSEANGDRNHASASEFRFLDKNGKAMEPAPGASHAPVRADRAWVWLAPAQVAKVTPPTRDKTHQQTENFEKAPPDAKEKGWYLRLRVTSTGPATAVLGGAAFTRPPVKTDRAMEVKGNSYGPYGPDYLGMGMLGIQGQVEHGDIGVPLLDPFPGTPAANAGIRNGDYLVAVEGRPLRPNFGHQEMGWLEDGHQPALGRAVADALRTDAPRPRQVRLSVLRAGKPLDLDLRLPDAAPLWKPDAPASEDAMLWRGPALDDPMWAAMEKDLVARAEKMCRPDGSFAVDGIDYIQVSIIGLALLQTRDPRHAERIARCADWCLAQPDLMNQWYWKVGYNGIFLTEYYLATGDERVRPWIENALVWLPLSTHVGSHAGMQTPGHGPEGLPYANSGLLAPALHALLFESLAEHAGFSGPKHDFHAQIKGYIDYSYADPARGGDGLVDYSPMNRLSTTSVEGAAESWTRTGLYHASMMLRGPWPGGETAGKTADAHSYRLYGSHAYGMPGAMWGVAALAGYAPKDYETVVRRHAWDWIAAWQPGYGLRVTMPHMGQPYMGWEGMNNPAWLMALGARRHVLHLSGGKERNWLDLSKVPARAGELRASVTAQGYATLECWPTGAQVRYTRDGSAPATTSRLGTDPDLNQGGPVLAQAFGAKNPVGAPKWLDVPAGKRHWKVLEATGWDDPAECLARAQLAIDGKPDTEWLTNAGEHPQPFPHRLVVDLGRTFLVSGAQWSRANFGHFTVSLSSDGKTWEQAADIRWKRGNQADGNHTLAETFNGPPKAARFVRLDILETAADVPGQKGDPGLFLGEFDVLEPQPKAQVANGVATLTAPAGFEIVATTDGKMPEANGPRLKNGAQLPLKKGQVLRARCVKEKWVGPEMLAEGK